MAPPGHAAAVNNPALAQVPISRICGLEAAVQPDCLAVEEPLEIRLGHDQDGQWVHSGISITMRTPGHDHELAVGFLFTEGILTTPTQVAGLQRCKRNNVVRVDLRPGLSVNLERLQRNFYTTSSCGVCGKTALAALQLAEHSRPREGEPVVAASVIQHLPATLRAAQPVFACTGGLHAAALFSPTGELLCLREDVGRHNALDKLIGAQFLAGQLPLHEHVLLVSGRTSFELVQKAAMAGIPILAAVGAPSSLAVELASAEGLTVLGFVRHDRFNIYTGANRIRLVTKVPELCPAGEGKRHPLSTVDGCASTG